MLYFITHTNCFSELDPELDIRSPSFFYSIENENLLEFQYRFQTSSLMCFSGSLTRISSVGVSVLSTRGENLSKVDW